MKRRGPGGNDWRAWLVTPEGLEDWQGVYAARSRGAARFAAWSAARDAGWTRRFDQLHTVRAPEFDPLVRDMYEGQGYSLEYARRELARYHFGDGPEREDVCGCDR